MSKTLETKTELVICVPLAIGSLINDAVKVFYRKWKHYYARKIPFALMDKANTKHRWMILSRSVLKHLSKTEVIEKEIVGYQIIQTLLDKFITAFNNK
jgi:dGTPase